MKHLLLILSFLWMSCTGSLTDDQRKRMKENMEQNEIKKVTESQIMDAAFQYGRQVASLVEKRDKTLSNTQFLDSLSKVYQVEIISLQSSNMMLRTIEKQILEAYQTAAGTENVQKMGPDSLLYTKPFVREHPDGSTEFLKAVGIRMTKKQIVSSIK